MKNKILIILAALLTGCVSSQHLVTGRVRPALAAEQVQLRSSAPADAEEIGIVTAVAGGHNNLAMQTAIGALKRQAGSMGANIIVVVGSDMTSTSSSGGLGYLFSSGVFYSAGSNSRETKVQAKAFYVQPEK